MNTNAKIIKKGVTHSKAQAPGQYLGYSLQTTRFLVHLLNANFDWTISLEVFEDVGSETKEGDKIAEQIKSTLRSNPVSDRSIELWKTFSNWVASVKSGNLNSAKTQFVLYTSHPKNGKIVEDFSKANTPPEARNAFNRAKIELWGHAPDFSLRPKLSDELKPYVDEVLQADEDMICSIIEHFNFKSGTGSPQEDLKSLFVKSTQFDDPELVEAALNYALGWVKRQIDILLEQSKSACIDVKTFRAMMGSFIRKYDRREILKTFASVPSQQEIEEDLRVRTYVRQLDIIEIDDGQKINAVKDFLRASVDRTQWSVRGLVHESSFDEFKDTLVRTWNNCKQKTEIALKGHSHIERGQYLYAECSSHHVKLENLVVPPHFTPGSFHALADNRIIGWHPDYNGELNEDLRKEKS